LSALDTRMCNDLDCRYKKIPDHQAPGPVPPQLEMERAFCR